MKANKALMRLAKIEALISVVTERYSAGAHHIREALHEVKAAVARVKAAISSQVPSRTAKSSAAKRKSSVKKVAAKPPAAKTAKKSAPMKKAAKAVAKKMAPASVQKTPTPVQGDEICCTRTNASTAEGLAPLPALTERSKVFRWEMPLGVMKNPAVRK
jgi:hypothetical protein